MIHFRRVLQLRWRRWVLVYLPLLVSVQLAAQLVLVHWSSPHGHSLKNRFFESSYGLFNYEVGEALCSSPELLRPPSLVLQQAHELLQQQPQLLAALRAAGEAEPLQVYVHWAQRFARRSAAQQLALLQQARQLESSDFTSGLSGLSEISGLDLTQEMLTAAFIFSECRRKGLLKAPLLQQLLQQKDSKLLQQSDSNEDLLQSLGVHTQLLLPSRFLGDPQRICWGFEEKKEDSDSSSSSSSGCCCPPLQLALQLLPLRLQRWWARARWQYHFAEYLRKLLTIWWPVDHFMHQFFRQDANALLALMSPYLELQPPVPLEPSCGAPRGYWVQPLQREQWQARSKRASPAAAAAAGAAAGPAAGAAGSAAAGAAGGAAAGDAAAAAAGAAAAAAAAPGVNSSGPRQSLAEKQKQGESGLYSIPEDHDNYVLIDDYCKAAREIHRGFFSGKPRPKPVKIVDAVILGYDLDLLEIRWHELQHTVDYFVVAEAHQHTLGVFQKPLFFERNRKRFAAFEKKIIHLVQPFAASLPVAESCSRRLLADQDACWEFEMFQRDSLLHMLAQLNAGAAGHGNAHVAPGFLQDEDLILVSDVDEIVMGDRLRHLKYCEPLPQKQFGWVLVHYPGRVDAMALKDFKVMSGIKETPFPHAIGPLVDTVPYKSIRHLEAKTDFVYESHAYTRHCPSSLTPHRYLHGGWHLSDTSYLPYLYAKVPSDDVKPGYEPWGLYAPLLAQRGELDSPVGGILQAQVAAWKDFRDYRQVGSLCVDAKDVPEQYKEIGFGSMPWVMRCNPMR
ncbi:hypothetical protein, conserved [Eimeria tenella]|uniref:Uncharacterized protein n=1 Tax=Eimeria tenella TaxID=5802 RepID=U6KW27_EIMTE|nr:hypothetical protein, conserved [Eimeria tenella]CDJ42337.1 hypothetical protein, conserved [Eimeria tenella]|eukprot:XP_013233087.1 hypothetical protein, conserved [Eimeria tenella]